MYTIEEYRTVPHVYEIEAGAAREFGRQPIVRSIEERRRAAAQAFRHAVIDGLRRGWQRMRSQMGRLMLRAESAQHRSPGVA